MNEETKIDEVEVVEGESLKFGGDREDLMIRGRGKKSFKGMAAFIIKISHGRISTEFQANIILLVIAAVFFVVSLFLFF